MAERTIQEAKDTICDLIAAAGGVLSGKVRLHKGFYFAHLFYWQTGEGVLTDHPIVRLPQGPFIDNGERLIEDLRREGILEIGSEPIGPFRQAVYRLLQPRTVDPDTARGRAIHQAVELVVNHTAVELSEITHEFSVTWQTTPDGREMDVYLDLVAPEDLDQIRREIASVRAREETVA